MWGYILEGQRRPKAEDQRAALKLLGVDVSPEGSWFLDKIKKGSTRPRGQLTERNVLVEKAVMPGDTVVVATPFCLGVSAADAKWFLSALAEKGVTVIVNGELTRIEPGQDTSEMVQAVARAQNVLNVYRSTGRIKK